ncbi:MAG: C-terminal binding protein [Rhodospirillales bacterium]|nr:C-terminal binding protein [Rhodospirillales bacterium]
MKVVFTDYGDYDLDVERRWCAAAGLDFEAAEPQCGSPAEVIRAARNAEALVVQYAPLTAEVFDALPKLRIVSVPQIGVDTIDLEAARRCGVWVANAPFGNITEVAAHTLAMALALLRGLPAFDRLVRAGVWDHEAAGALRRPGTLTYGILGLGRIGRLVAERARPFFGRVVAFDAYLPEEAWPDFVERQADLPGLFAASDVVSLHVPLTAENTGLVGAELLAAMKPGGVLVNVARGAVLDRSALLAALDEGRLAGAGLDVLPQEPPAPDDPLLKHEKLLLSPHAAFYSVEADQELRRTSVENVAEFARSGRPRHVVVEGR